MTLQRFKSMEDLTDELQCAVCLEFYNVPVILPCSHLLCREPCAARLFDRGFIKCPVCRDSSYVLGGVANLPRVITIESIIERYQECLAEEGTTPSEVCRDGDIPCQLCSGGQPKRAKKSCQDCNASYCSSCLQMSHPNREPFSNHRLVDPKRDPKPKLVMCEKHNQRMSVYCETCCVLGCVLCCHLNVHNGHTLMAIPQGYTVVKGHLEVRLKQMEKSQEAVSGVIKLYKDQLRELQETCQQRRTQITHHCNSLIEEIESRKDFLLRDVDYEEGVRSERVRSCINTYQQQLLSQQSVSDYAQELMKETDPSAFLQLAASIQERVSQGAVDPSSLQVTPIDTSQLKTKVVDFRKEKAILRDMTYLPSPAVPAIDVTKSTRSTNSVVLVLAPPTNELDVIDGYTVYYCSEVQKATGQPLEVFFRTPQEERSTPGRPPRNNNPIVFILGDLQHSTMYYFCVSATNQAGNSANSEVVNCMTLEPRMARVPVPQITEDNCRTYTTSIQIYSESPVVGVAAEQNISHFLLYREALEEKVWKSVPMFGRLEHRVFNLESDMEYQFQILACNSAGACSMSDRVSLKTERSAY